MEKLISLAFYLYFWVALAGFFFIGVGVKTSDTDLIILGFPFACIGTVLAIVTLKISNTFKG